MKKKIIIIACLSTGFAHGMQTTYLLEITEKSLSIIAHGTPINLFKESIFEPSNPISLTVIGNHQQNMLQECPDQLGIVGHTYVSSSGIHSIFKRNKDNDSDSDDDTYHPHPHHVDKQTSKNGHTIRSMILEIDEPYISNSTPPENYGVCTNDSSECKIFTIPSRLINNFVYEAHGGYSIEHNRFVGSYCKEIYEGAIAIEKAAKDLALCYTKALTIGSTLQYSDEKSIALPTLSADVGFPREKAAPIAVTTALEYVKNNPEKYKSINFFVKKQSDFALYKKLLMQECNLLEKICLLFCANKAHEHFLSHIPLDVITQILLILHSLQK